MTQSNAINQKNRVHTKIHSGQNVLEPKKVVSDTFVKTLKFRNNANMGSSMAF